LHAAAARMVEQYNGLVKRMLIAGTTKFDVEKPTTEILLWDCKIFLRLPALMDLYIHPLYVLVSKILSSILNSPALIHPLYHSLSTVGLTCHFI
jgi:hypothetical protein